MLESLKYWLLFVLIDEVKLFDGVDGLGGSADVGMGLSPFSQQGQPGQSPSWLDNMMSIEGNRSAKHLLKFSVTSY